MNAVDAILNKQVAVAQMLATSPALQADDLAAFRQEAERAAPGLSGGWIVLSDQDGQQLINLIRPAGEPLPRRPPNALALQRRAIETGQVQISDVFTGAVAEFARGHGRSAGPAPAASRRSASPSAWSRASSCRCSNSGICRRAGSPA